MAIFSSDNSSSYMTRRDDFEPRHIIIVLGGSAIPCQTDILREPYVTLCNHYVPPIKGKKYWSCVAHPPVHHQQISRKIISPNSCDSHGYLAAVDPTH